MIVDFDLRRDLNRLRIFLCPRPGEPFERYLPADVVDVCVGFMYNEHLNAIIIDFYTLRDALVCLVKILDADNYFATLED